MKILVVESGRQPYIKEISNSLVAKQQIVGGPIDVIYPWDDSAVIVLNDEGKNLGLEMNRVIGKIKIAGTFFVCGQNQDGDLLSITNEQAKKYMSLFSIS